MFQIVWNIYLTIGAGAWQGWKYEIEMWNNETDPRHLYGNLSQTSITIESLQSDTAYDFRVRAQSTGGIGPWSKWFKGQTLCQGEQLTPGNFGRRESFNVFLAQCRF